MAINSITSGGGNKPINVNDSQKPVQVNNKSHDTTAPSSAPASTDTVSITGAASQLRSLEQHLATLPVVDAQRVDAVKREITNGTFEINPPRIADKMIQIETAINRGLF